MRIYKTKWYICRALRNIGGVMTGYCVEAWRGAFKTESQAFQHMYEDDPSARPEQGRLQRRKSGFSGRFPKKGERIRRTIDMVDENRKYRNKIEWERKLCCILQKDHKGGEFILCALTVEHLAQNVLDKKTRDGCNVRLEERPKEIEKWPPEHIRQGQPVTIINRIGEYQLAYEIYGQTYNIRSNGTVIRSVHDVFGAKKVIYDRGKLYHKKMKEIYG